MRQITKWLNSLNPTSFVESTNTSSVYYIVKGLKIRLADHFTINPRGCDLQIICPINDYSMYTVIIKEGLQVLGYKSVPQLAAFINDYALIHRIKKTSEEMKAISEMTPLEADSIVNAKQRTSKKNWVKVARFIAVDCPKWKELNSSQKGACKNLFNTNRDYYSCIRIINTVLDSTDWNTKTLHEYFEPYINKKIK